jgi:aminopeptidase N
VRSIYRYSAACYFEVVYVQGARVLDGIRRRAGDAAFFGALREYLAARRHGFGSTAELLAALDAVDPADLTVRLRPRFPRIL